MADSHDWQMARRVSRLVAHSPGRGLRRGDLAAGLDGTGLAMFDKWVGLAYRRGWVDCVRDYVVAPTLGSAPDGLGLSSRGLPQAHGAGPLLESPDTTPGRGSAPRGEPLFPAADSA